MEVVGYNVTMTGQGVSGLRGRTYCNVQERGSSSGGASAYDMDLIYDSPKGYKGSASPSVIQLYHDGLSVNNMELQVMLPFRFVPYEPDDCATPRIPPSEFSPPIPLTYWVVRYECTTPRLTHACPHWYDGKWAASAWSPRGGIAGSFIQPSQFLSVSGVSLTMTAGEKGKGEEEGTDVVSTQYAFKCTQHFISDTNSNLEINLGVDFATTHSAPSHVSRGVALFSSFPGQFDLTFAQPNWCQRPYDTNNAFIHPVSFEPPHVTSTFVCVEPILQDACTYFLLGTWRGESSSLAQQGDMNDHSWNASRRHGGGGGGGGGGGESTFWVASEFNGRGWLEEANITCSASGEFPSLLELDVHHAAPSSAHSSSSSSSSSSNAMKVAGWITHGLVRFGTNYHNLEVVLGEPGKCNRPTSSDLINPSGGFASFRMECAIPLLEESCPPWLIGRRNTTDISFLSGIRVEGGYVRSSPFALMMSIPNNVIFSRVTCGSMFGRVSNVSSSVAVDINITSPSSLSSWVQRGWASYKSDVGAVQLHVAAPGVCLRPQPNENNDDNSQEYSLHPQNQDHIRSSLYECSTPPLIGACPRWLDGNWNILLSAEKVDADVDKMMPEWMDDSIEPVNFTVVGSRAQVGIANGAVILHWMTCEVGGGGGGGGGGSSSGGGSSGSGPVMVDLRPDTQSPLAGRTLRVLVSFDEHRGTLKMSLANHGWCSRPSSMNDVTFPYHANVYSCITPLVGSSCPRWLDGHWDVLESVAPSRRVFEWDVTSNLSSIAVATEEERAKDEEEGVPNVKEDTQLVVYCGVLDDSPSHIAIDWTYLSNETNLPVVERGWLRRASILPRSSAHLVRSPPNWCYRHSPTSTSIRADTVNCSTSMLQGRCPGWMRGTWKFHDSKLYTLTTFTSSLNFQPRKWLVSNDVHDVRIDDAEGVRGAALNCSDETFLLNGLEYVYVDISYNLDESWRGRMDHVLMALDASNPDTRIMSLVEAPPGWCSRPPMTLATVRGQDEAFPLSTAVQVDSPRQLSVFSVLPLWETLELSVSVATTTMRFVWDDTVDDRNSPVDTYLLTWDVDSQISVCDVSLGGQGTFGRCCDRDDHCSSGVCDSVRRVCTYICRVDTECPAAQPGLRPARCLELSGSYHDPVPKRQFCDAAQDTPFGETFCQSFCNKDESGSMHGVAIRAVTSAASTECEDDTRELCRIHRFSERACHDEAVRQYLRLSGSATFDRDKNNATVHSFVVGHQYYGQIYARNEVGYGWPTKSLPAFEIARAAPPPPSSLLVTQVKASTLNASGMTLEDAKTSIKVSFESPAFDNGADVTGHYVEWHVHPSFVDESSRGYGEGCLAQKEQVAIGPMYYGTSLCGVHCLRNDTKSSCSDYPSCPFAHKNESAALCSDMAALSTSAAPAAADATSSESAVAAQCIALRAEINLAWESDVCAAARAHLKVVSQNPDRAFSVAGCEQDECMSNLKIKMTTAATTCGDNETSASEKYVALRCSRSANGTSCGDLLPELKREIDFGTLTCKRMRRTYSECSETAWKFWTVVETSSEMAKEEHYGRTKGVLHNQTSTRRRRRSPKYADALRTLDVSCPRVLEEICPTHNITDLAVSCGRVRDHCSCHHPLDPGCSHPHVMRRLSTEQTTHRMSVPSSLFSSTYSIVVSNVLPRTPYYVRVGALNEIGVSMYRTTPKSVAALVIAEKPLDVNIFLLDNITNTSTRAALSTSIFLRFRTAAIDWNWVTHYRVDVSTLPSFNDTKISSHREILIDQPTLHPFASGLVNLTIGQLTPGVRYYVQVAAYITTYGRPQVAKPLSIVPPLQVPDPPRNFTVYPLNGTLLGVNWSIPIFDGGRPLLAHRLEWSRHANFTCAAVADTNGRSEHCGMRFLELPLVKTPLDVHNQTSMVAMSVHYNLSLTTTIKDVSMGQFYHVRISSCNDLGCGVLAVHHPVKPMQPPSVPLQVGADVQNHSALSVTFAAPESNGGDVVDRYVVRWMIPGREGMSATKIVLPTADLFRNVTRPVPPPWTGCNCTSTLPHPSLQGSCCCIDLDCAGSMSCHPLLRSCTYRCAATTTESGSGSEKSGEKNGCVAMPLGGGLLAGDSIVLLSTTCNSTSNGTSKSISSNRASNSTSSSLESTKGDASLASLSTSAFCEVGCPFNQTDPQSPCLFRSHPMAIDQSSCSTTDFEGGWVLSSVFGGIHDLPSIGCATYIRRYCTSVAGSQRAAAGGAEVGGEGAGATMDPACLLQAIKHLLHDIPTCPQRDPPTISEGLFARVVVLALVPPFNATTGSSSSFAASHRLGVSACNAAGCSELSDYDRLVTPAAQLMFSDSTQCSVEGGLDRYYVSLNSRPLYNVTVSIEGDQGQLVAAGSTSTTTGTAISNLVFTPDDWNVRKMVVVTALDDDYDEGEGNKLVLRHTLVTNDTLIARSIKYLPERDVRVLIHDNDYAGIAVSKTSVLLEEGREEKVVTYRSMTRPYGEVELLLIPLLSASASVHQIIVSPDASSWYQPHHVLFRAVDDDVDELDIEVEHVSWSIVSSSDSTYLEMEVPVLSAMVVDNDFASLLLDYSFLQLDEGRAAATYRIHITSRPTSLVAVVVSVGTAPGCSFVSGEAGGDGAGKKLSCAGLGGDLRELSTDVWVTENGEVAVDEAVLFFYPETWNETQFFMVSAREDDMDLGMSFNITLAHTSISDDFKYHRGENVVVPLSIRVEDNDEAVLTMSRWDVVVTQDGLYEDSYSILFETMPTSVSCIHASLLGFDHVRIAPTTMCFGATNWSLPQSFHVSATLGGERGAVVGWIKHSLTTDAPEYAGKELQDVEITIVERFSDLDLTDAPTYISASFSDVAHEIVIRFGTPAYVTTFGADGDISELSCDQYFIARVLRVMGEDPRCYWTDQFTLHAALGAGWTVASQQKITLRSGAIRTTSTSIITSGGYHLLSARRPAPLLDDVYFAESGGAVYLQFRSTIGCWEGLRDTSETSCSNVVENAEWLLGIGADCTWVKSCLLQATLGFGAQIRATRDVRACGSCECASCVPTAAYEQAGGTSEELCHTPAQGCSDPQCFCRDVSPLNLCPLGMSLSLMPGAVKAIRYGLLSTEGCMHVRHPGVVFVPRSIITAPRNFPVCSSLVVTGTESETSGGGRDQFVWNVLAFDNDAGGLKYVPDAAAEVIARANALNSDTLNFPPNIFEFGARYRFSLQISNFLTASVVVAAASAGGATTNATTTTKMTTTTTYAAAAPIGSRQVDYQDIVASYIPLPELTIVGPAKRVVMSRDRVVIRALALPAKCANDQSLVYSWYQVQGDLDWERVKTGQRGNYELELPMLVLEPHTLTRGTDYIFRVSAHARSTPTLTNYENVVVKVESGSTVAGLDSYHRTSGSDDALSINAEDHSYHEDDADARLSYQWRCVYVFGGDGRVCNAMKYSSGLESGVLILPRNTFAAGDEILFTVDVALLENQRDTSSANMTVTVVQGLTPIVKILQGSRVVINPEDKLSLSGTVEWQEERREKKGGEKEKEKEDETSLSLSWAETSGALDLLSETQPVYYSVLNRPCLVVRPNLLVPGRQYTFVLRVVGDQSSGSASILVEVNRPPRGGYFDVTPTTGRGLETEFHFSMGSWADDENNYPLTYNFYYARAPTTSTTTSSAPFPLSVESVETPRQTFRLPPGIAATEYKLYPSAHVCDSLGACTVCTTKQDSNQVEIEVLPLSSSETMSFFQRAVDSEHASTRDTAVIGVAADMLYPDECDLPRTRTSITSECVDILDQHRTNAENMLTMLAASEAITLPSKVSLEQQAMTLAEISNFAGTEPSNFVFKLIEHGNRIVDSAFGSGLSLSTTTIIGLHATFESLVDAVTQPMHMNSTRNKSWAAGQKVAAGIERAVSNALLMHVMGEDPLIISGAKLSVFGKVELLANMRWVPLAFLNFQAGPIGFSMPSQIKDVDSAGDSLQFVAVAQSEQRGLRQLDGSSALPSIVTDLSLYDKQARRIPLVNLKHPIGISLPVRSRQSSVAKCFFWDGPEERWSERGLFVEEFVRQNESDMSTIGCATTHLTSFLLETTQALPLRDAGSTTLNQSDISRLTFVFDTSNIPVVGVIVGMSTFYLLLLLAIHIYEHQTVNNEYEQACMERFLSTGSTCWVADKDEEYGSITSFLRSYVATLAHQHPIIGWTRQPRHLGMPRVCYVLILWNTTSIMFFASCASIGGAELSETELLPLGWIFSLCGLVMVATARNLFSCLSVWRSKQIGGSACCCNCARRPHVITLSRKSLNQSKSPTRLWVDFERLRTRCIAYALHSKIAAAAAGGGGAKDFLSTPAATADIVMRNEIQSGSTSGSASGGSAGGSGCLVLSSSGPSSYERYAVLTAQEHGYPYPRSVFESVVMLQAAWRGYVVKTNLHSFHEKNASIKSSLTKRRSYVSSEDAPARREEVNGGKYSKEDKERTDKKNRHHSKGKNGRKNGKHSDGEEQAMTERQRQRQEEQQNQEEQERLRKQDPLTKKLRQATLILQSCVSASGSMLILVGVSELFDPLNRQYGQASLVLGFLLISLMILGSFTLKYCNGVHLSMYFAAHFVAGCATLGLLLMVSGAGDQSDTTLSVVRSEWQALFETSTTSSSSLQLLDQWQRSYQCCGMEDQNIMSVPPCSLNTSLGCEGALSNRVKESLISVHATLMLSTVLQVLALCISIPLSMRLDFRSFDNKRLVEAVEEDSAKVIQAFARGKNPSDSATSRLFTGLTKPTTYKASNIIQNIARGYLARRRCYRKQEYDRFVGIDTRAMRSLLQGSIFLALAVSALVLDVLAVALAIKFDSIRAARWRQSMELSCAVLFCLLIPMLSVATVVLDPRWKAWLRIRCWTWHEVSK